MFNIHILSLPLCLISQSKLYFQNHLFYQAYLPLDSYLFRPCKLPSAAYFTLIHQYLVVLQHLSTLFIIYVHFTFQYFVHPIIIIITV